MNNPPLLLRPVKRHHVGWFIWVFFATLLGFCVVFFLIFGVIPHFFMGKDSPAPNDSSLLLPNIDISPASNGYSTLLQANQAVVPPADGTTDTALDMITGKKPWDQAMVDDRLTKNEKALALYYQAATFPYLNNPKYLSVSSAAIDTLADTNDIQYAQTLARTAALDAWQAHRRGDDHLALQKSAAIVAIGSRLANGRNVLIGYLVGSAVEQIGLTVSQMIALHAKPPPDTIHASLAELNHFRDNSLGLADAFRFEYLHIKYLTPRITAASSRDIYGVNLGDMMSMNETINTDPGNSILSVIQHAYFSAIDALHLTHFYFKPMKTLQFSVDEFGARVAIAQLPCDQVKSEYRYQHLIDQSQLAQRAMFTENAMGKMLFSMGQIAYGSMNVRRCQIPLAISASQLTGAIHAYANDHAGQLPDQLDLLIPAYVTAVPLDPFSGQAMKYNKAKGVIYSIGINRKDLGGSTGDDWTKMENPTFDVR